MASNNDGQNLPVVAVDDLGSGSLSPDSDLEAAVAKSVMKPSPSPKPTESETSAARPKTVGGFIADDSDEEEGIVTETISTPVPVVAETAVNEPVTAPAPAQVTPSIAFPVTPTYPPPQTQGTLVPKARLPHDRTGLLEDRIKEDPRGDLDAWLSLINEHRKRNKLDDAREVYERFFKVFPTAVSHLL